MKLFLSYNTRNRPFVEWIANCLQQNGFEVFFDQYDLYPGDSWIRKIEQGINESEAALIFIGTEGIGEWQNKEALKIVNLRTKNTNYRLIPVIISQVNGFINYPLPWFLADYQWVEFKDTGDSYAYSKLLEGLRAEKQVLTIGENPYKGLDSFGVNDAPHFFGRTYDTNLVFHNKLRLNAGIKDNNFLAVVAGSGTGKSSFVQAGVLAAFKNGRFTGSEAWKQVILKPGSGPLTALSAQLVICGLIADRDSRDFEEDAKKHDDELLRRIRNQQQTWVIYIDQFEEVISQCKDEEERKVFLNNIGRAIETDKAIVLLSLRSDFYTAFAPYTFFKSILEKNNYTLSAIDSIEKSNDESDFTLREIIVQPARNAGVEVQRTLVDTLINDIKQVKGKLPILQLTLDLLWKNKSNLNKITVEDYAAISKNSSIAGIIQTHADGIFNNITNDGTNKEKVELIRKLFVPHLVEVSENGDDVRRTATKEELLKIKNNSKTDIESLLDELSSGRLLAMRETANNQTKVEVVHEVIIREWSLLKSWIDERRAALIYLERLAQDAEEYKAGSAELYSGKKLHKAIDWKNKNEDLVNEQVATFINQSEKKAKRKWVAPVTISLILLAGITVAYWFHNKLALKSALIEKIKNNHNLKIQWEAAGGALDSIRYLTLDNDGYNLIQENFSYFKELDSLYLDGVDVKNFSFSGLDHLKNLTLTDIDSIRNLSLPASLTSLIISNNNLTSLPALENLKSLSSLTISDNRRLTSLPVLENLTSLSSLTIFDNGSLTNLPALANLNSLSSLTISDNGRLTKLPALVNLTSLSSITISNNSTLKKFPSLENLRSLSSLTVAYNDSLTSLPALENLSSLSSLTIADNGNLTSLPALENLKSLSSLTISDNGNLTSIPVLANLRSLSSLTISYNDGLTILPALENLDSLSKLTISFNSSLTSIPALAHLNSLSSLTISDYSILIKLPAFENIKSLSSLTISENDGLTSLPVLENLKSLSSLTISDNRSLTSLPALESLESLSALTISDNRSLTSLPALANLKLLSSLIISDNISLTELPALEHLNSLSSLTIADNDILTSLPFLENLHSLSTLTISNNSSLTSIPPLMDLNSLSSIIIYDNDSLSSLPALKNLNSLSSLTVSKNSSLTSFPALENLKSLSSLTVSKNDSLISFSALDNLNSLSSLTISENSSLTSLPALENLKSLSSLTIYNNYSLTRLPALEYLDLLTELRLGRNEGQLMNSKIYNLTHLKKLTVPKEFKIDYALLSKNNPGIKLIRKD